MSSESCFKINPKEPNKNEAIHLEINILCVLSDPFCFRFHGNAYLWRNTLDHIYKLLFRRGKNAEFGTERAELKSQHSQLILLVAFWQVTSLLESSISSLKKKEKEKQTGKCNAIWWLGKDRGQRVHRTHAGLQGEGGEQMASVSSFLKWLK